MNDTPPGTEGAEDARREKREGGNQGWTSTGERVCVREGEIMALATFSLSLITLALTNLHLSRASNRHAVYWNSSNIM